MKLIPFDLEKALAGAEVRTRNGIKVKSLEKNGLLSWPLRGIVNGSSLIFRNNGTWSFDGKLTEYDLFLVAPEPKPKPRKNAFRMRQRTMEQRLLLPGGDTMTNEEINAQIAEVYVNSLNLTAFQNLSGLWILVDQKGRTFGYNHSTPSKCFDELIKEYAKKNYAGDLNAMHEAAMSQAAEFRMKMNNILIEMMPATKPYQLDRTINATARQRAEAFLRTLNLWKS